MTDHEMFRDFCDNCGMDFYRLVDCLINDIQHLESKVVYLRYSLSKFLPEYNGNMLRCEIFSDLSGSYIDQSAYQQYVSEYCYGQDPMDTAEYCQRLMRISCGKESVDL
jgi:hypothetical protein